jgi:hypothetical protein
MKDEWWIMKDEWWKMKDERWMDHEMIYDNELFVFVSWMISLHIIIVHDKMGMGRWDSAHDLCQCNDHCEIEMIRWEYFYDRW